MDPPETFFWDCGGERRYNSLTPRLEKILHQLPTFFLKDATNDDSLGMHSLWRIVMIAALLIHSPIDNTRNLCPSDGSGTHRTGLYGDIQCTVSQVFPAKGVCSRGDGLHLSMGRHVAECFRQVVSPGDDTVFAYHNGPDGYFTCLIGDLGLVKRHPHISFVFNLLFHAAKLRKKVCRTK